MKFTRYKDRNLIFRNKKLLKRSGISVTESLTLKRMEHLKKAREQHGFADVWTMDGKIMFKGNDGNPKVYYISGFHIADNVRGKTSQLCLFFTLFIV